MTTKKAPSPALVGEFNAAGLLHSMQEFVGDLKTGKAHTLRSSRHVLPARLPMRTPEQIRAVRMKLNASQPVFAALLNVPKSTVVGWENSQRKPTGAALKLLDLADKHPEVFIGDSAPSRASRRATLA